MASFTLTIGTGTAGRRLLLSPSLSEDGTKVDEGDLYRSRCPAHRKQRRKTTAHQSPSTRGGRRRRCLKPPEREMHRSSTMVADSKLASPVHSSHNSSFLHAFISMTLRTRCELEEDEGELKFMRNFKNFKIKIKISVCNLDEEEKDSEERAKAAEDVKQRRSELDDGELRIIGE
nr:hypothetical protein Iba_chr07aCG8120 [Ipomoea batatas]